MLSIFFHSYKTLLHSYPIFINTFYQKIVNFLRKFKENLFVYTLFKKEEIISFTGKNDNQETA